MARKEAQETISPQKGTPSYYKVDPSLYISEAALDAIYALEGYEKGAEMTDKLTTYYGITDNGLAQLKELKKNYYVDVPQELLTATVKGLTKEQAREVTKYIAVHNSMRINEHFGENNTFMNLPLHIRSAVLTDYHRGGVPSIADSWKDPDKPGSIMKAFETGSREKIALALISNADGSIIKYKNDEKNGQRNRHLAAVRLMYDTENNSFPDKKTAQAVYGEWQNKPGYIPSVANTLNLLDKDLTNRRERGESEMVHAYYGVSNEDEMKNKSEEASKLHPKPVKEEPEKDENYTIYQKAFKAVSDFTNSMKNLFTNNQEDKNATTGNEDINLQ